MRARVLLALLALTTGLVGAATFSPAGADTTGFRDFSYSGTTAPTGQKPQSKLWFNDGVWWGSLFNRATTDFEIYRYDWPTHTWSTTGTVIDERGTSFMDTLWDGNKLFVATAGTSTSTTGHQARVVRYSYDSVAKRYTRDSGFPVNITNAGVKSIVLAKDSTDTLWATYTQGGKVWVLHSLSGHASWTKPYVLPVTGAQQIGTDEISAVVHYDGNKIGVMWSNQNDSTMYWASHADGQADTAWTEVAAYRRPEGADDHINLKSLQADHSGRVFAAVKTSLNGSSDPLINLLALRSDGSWTSHEFGKVADNHTRAIVQIDSVNRQLYMFAASPCCSGGVIYMKQTSLDSLAFPAGKGTPFIASSTDPKINNPTSSKHTVSPATGLIVMAGDDSTKTYLHNRLTLGGTGGGGGGGGTTPTAPDTSITDGPSGTTTSTSASFSFTSTASGATYECSLDGAAFTACASPKTYSGLPAGSHTFSVRSSANGLTDSSPATRTWTISSSTTPTLFSDNFEGGFDGWSVVTAGSGTAGTVAGAGSGGSAGARFAADATTSSVAYARRGLGSSYNQVTVSTWVVAQSAGGTNAAPILRLRDSSGAVVASVIRRSESGRLQVSFGGSTYSSTAYLPLGKPVQIVLKVGVAGSGVSTVELLVDGVSAYRTTTASLSSAVANLQIGSDWKQEPLTVVFDDVSVRSGL